MKDFTIQLQANTPHYLNAVGTSYHIQEATAPLKLSFNNGESITRERTQGARVGQFESVRLESKTAQLVTVVLGDGLVVDGRTELSDQTINVDVGVSGALFEQDDVTVGASAVSVVASNANRKKVLIGVPSSSDDSIRIGSANVSNTAGLIVEAGSTISLDTTGQIFAISTGGNVVVSVLEQGDF